MVLIGLVFLCGILSFLSLQSRNVLVAIGAAISWIFLLIFTRDNPIWGVTIGSTGDQMFLLLCGGMAMALPLMSLLQHRRERAITDRGFMVSDTGNIAGSERTTRELSEEEKYRVTVHRALHPKRRR